MQDLYANFAQLAALEPPGNYRISAVERGSPIAVLAPHGGGIEPGTSEICTGIAGDDWSCYCFEGCRVNGNHKLHITSHHFDEPQCLDLIGRSRLVLTVHGEGSDEDVVYVGGRHERAMAALRGAMAARGFDVRAHQNLGLQARHKLNICNRGQLGEGVQLELARGMRQTLFLDLSTRAGRRKTTERFSHFCEVTRQALGSIFYNARK